MILGRALNQKGDLMSKLQSTAKRVWQSAQLYIGFHRDPKGKMRDQAHVWPPKNAHATIDSNPEDKEAFVVVKSADPNISSDVQIKLHPDKIVLRRDEDAGWEGIVLSPHRVSVQVNGTWIIVNADGSIAHDKDGDMTYVEADGAVLKKTQYVDAMMSGDGQQLSRRTPTTIAAITLDGVIAKGRDV